MELQVNLEGIVFPVIDRVPDVRLRETLKESFAAGEAVGLIEGCFAQLPARRWTEDVLAWIFHSWKASHLKMLAIYGLTCRLQRLAMAARGGEREHLFLAAARNAETSHEDLGLDAGGGTHAELYDAFAATFLPNHPWQLEEFCLPAAREFRQWIYRNMVVEEIPRALLTNMFSEIYNHGEYTLALAAFGDFIDRHYNFPPEQKRRALRYISVHVEADTEVDHFMVVVEALDHYRRVTGRDLDYEGAWQLFTEYLSRLGRIMRGLTEMMEAEQTAPLRGAFKI